MATLYAKDSPKLGRGVRLSLGDPDALLPDGLRFDTPPPLGELATRIDGEPRLMNRQKAVMGAQEAWTCYADAAAADFGFAATVPRREALARTHAWYQDNGWYGR